MHFPEGGVPKEGPSAGHRRGRRRCSRRCCRCPCCPGGPVGRDHAHRAGAAGGRTEGEAAGGPARGRADGGPARRRWRPRSRSCRRSSSKGLEIVYVDNFIDVLPHALLASCRSRRGWTDVTEVTMAARYAPHEVEERLMKGWLDRSAFHADADDPRPAVRRSPSRRPTSPARCTWGTPSTTPSRTSSSATTTCAGYNTLWVVGTDHAGIATQNKVEGQLAGEGLRKEDLGREAFEKRVWEWQARVRLHHHPPAEAPGLRLRLRVASASPWTRATSKAVAKVFVDLYEKGDIYRDVYLVNWCTRCGSAISDLEVEHEDRAAKLYYVKYPIVGSDESLTVATTRPETILGDTAVAVNPKDPRYGRFVGQHGRGAAGRARGAHHRRRARGHRLRHRRSQDHARARPQRLGDRACATACRASRSSASTGA